MFRYLLLLYIPVISRTHFIKEKNPTSKELKFPLKNYNNEAYTISVSIGAPPQPLELLLSTYDSSLSWIVSSDCENCRVPENAYNSSKSTTYVDKGISSEINFSALLSTDNFELAGDFKSNQFFWLATDNFTYTGPLIDGVFNLGLDNPNNLSFIESLYFDGIIDSTSFALYLNDIDNNKAGIDSMLFLGSADLKPYIGDSWWFDIDVYVNEGRWITRLEMVFIGDQEYYYDYTYAAFDVQSPYIYIPEFQFLPMLDYFINSHGCDNISNIIECSDTNITNYPGILFELSGEIMYIDSSSYLKYNNETNKVVMLLMPISSVYWVLGSPFLRQFISVFAIDAWSTWKMLYLAYLDINLKKSSSNSNNSFWNDWGIYFFIGIGVAGVLITAILFIVLYRFRKRRLALKKDENSKKLIDNVVGSSQPESRSKPSPSPAIIYVENPSDSDSEMQQGSFAGENQQENAGARAYQILTTVETIERREIVTTVKTLII